jgi:hypothetical protein
MKTSYLKMITLFIILISFKGAYAVNETKGKVFFKNIKNEQIVPVSFKVEMGLEGMNIKKAGETPDDKVSGHHHLIIDGMAMTEGQVIPNDEKHLHFGKGQTELELKLAPGEHTLTLQFADGAHRSYGEKLSSTVKVHVK